MSHSPIEIAKDEQLNVFTHLYERFHHKVYRHAYRLLAHQQDAEDVTQEVFLRVHKKWHTLYDRANLLPWLYLVATNLSIDLLRLRLRISSYVSLTDSFEYDDDEAYSHSLNISLVDKIYGSERCITSVAEREHIALTLARMPKRYAHVLFLSTVLDIPYQEIALKLNVSPGAAAACVTRAKKRFTQEYQHILGQEDEFERRARV
jgi:RNA polymerase sigma-70 factor (ECF subfamily)